MEIINQDVKLVYDFLFILWVFWVNFQYCAELIRFIYELLVILSFVWLTFSFSARIKFNLKIVSEIYEIIFVFDLNFQSICFSSFKIFLNYSLNFKILEILALNARERERERGREREGEREQGEWWPWIRGTITQCPRNPEFDISIESSTYVWYI